MSAGKYCCAILAFAIAIALPVAMIAMGSIYIEDCPREKFIPIYLIVAGAVAVFKTLILVGCYVMAGDEPKKGVGFLAVINIFLFAWFIAGSYWIYHIHNDYQSDSKILSNYCNEQLYLFAFWVQIVFFIMMAIEILGGCIKLCCNKS